MPGKGQREPEIEGPREPNRAEEEIMDIRLKAKLRMLKEAKARKEEKERRIEAQGGPAAIREVVPRPGVVPPLDARQALAAVPKDMRITLYPPFKYPTLPQPIYCTMCGGPLSGPFQGAVVDANPVTGQPTLYRPYVWRCESCRWFMAPMLAPPPEEGEIVATTLRGG